jgi:iron complex transport system substrate-binding protein
VASLKLCTDELLLMLARPEQIASVTYLSQEPHETPLWAVGRRHRKNDGSLLSVAALAPDLVLDMGSGGRDTARIAQRLGMRMLTLPYPQTLGDIEQSVRTVAAALHRRAAGERLVADIESLKRSAPPARLDTMWLGGGGRSVAADSLAAQWMALAGLRQRALQGDKVTLEQLLVRPPKLLLKSSYRGGQYSSEQRWLSHRLVRKRAIASIVTDGRRWTCMGPLMIAETLRLRRLLRR